MRHGEAVFVDSGAWITLAGKIERVMLRLPGLHQRDEHIETVAFRRVPFRIHQAFDFLENAAIVSMCLDGVDVHALSMRPAAKEPRECSSSSSSSSALPSTDFNEARV